MPADDVSEELARLVNNIRIYTNYFSLQYDVVNLVFICIFIRNLVVFRFQNAQSLQPHQLDDFAAFQDTKKEKKRFE